MSDVRNIVPQSSSDIFPGCALSCQVLLQGQANCIPPVVGVAAQINYDQCFCQSPWLTPFYSTPDSVCAGECTIAGDRQLLQAWYKGFCQLVSQGVDATAPDSTAAVSSAASSVAGQAATATGQQTGQTTNTGSAAGSSSAHRSSGGNTWIDTHWQWVMGICLIILGLIGFTFLILWLKRRHRRKVEKRRSAISGFKHDPEKRPEGLSRNATQELWGPHQMMQATKGYQYTTEGAATTTPPKKHRTSHQHGESSRAVHDSETIEPEARAMSPVKSNRTRPDDLEKNARLIGAADRHSKIKKSKLTIRNLEDSLQGKAKLKNRDDAD